MQRRLSALPKNAALVLRFTLLATSPATSYQEKDSCPGSASASTMALTKTCGIVDYCAATARATVSSLSKSILFVSSSGKTIGSSFLAG